MTLEDFIEKFAFAIEVEPETLSANTEFKTLEIWDSLNTLSLIAMADADYNVALSGQDVQSSQTISDLWGLIEAKIAAV
jgi:acyl carrier protein